MSSRPRLGMFITTLVVGWMLLVPAQLEPPWGLGESPAWRPTAGRLSGLSYAPFVRSWPRRPNRVETNHLTKRLRVAAKDDARLQGAQVAAYLYLARGELDEAIREIERALALHSHPRPDLVNDLAAFRIERSRQAEHAFEAVQALDALAALPRRDPAQAFNFALAVERFGMRAAAERAWRDAARLNAGSGWGSEAAQRARTLAAPPYEATWSAWQARLVAGDEVSASEVDHWAHRLPWKLHDATLYEVLGEWGRRCGDRSEEKVYCVRLINVASTLAASLTSRVGPELSRAVEQLRGAAPASRRALASGYDALGNGWRASERLEIESARRSLATAVERLDEGGSPLLAWAQYWLAATDLHRGRYAECRSQLAALERRVRGRRLQGSITRTMGSTYVRQRMLPLAERLYRDAIAHYEAAGDALSAAVVRGYITDVLFAQGRSDEGWKLATASLQELSEWPTGDYWPYLLNNAARAMIWQSQPAAGALLAEESAHSLERSNADAVVIAEAWLLLGQARVATERTQSARLALRPAAAAVHAIPDPHLRERMGAYLALATGLVESDPERAVAALSMAVRTYERVGFRLFLPAAYASRARAYTALGRLDQAAEDLRLGIAEHERVLAQFADPLSAVPFAEVEQRLYDLAVRLELDRSADPWRAFVIADRAKSAALFRGSPGQSPTPLLYPQVVRAAVQSGEAIVAYTDVDDRLLITLITPSRVLHRVVALDSAELASRATRFLSLLASKAAEADIRHESAWLFTRLIGPVQPALDDVHRLVFIPDRALNLVPFAALVDPGKSEYLVERHALVVCPSVQHWLAQRVRRDAAPVGAWKLGVVSTERLSPRDEALPALPGATREVRDIAALYSSPTVLLGQQATASGFLGLLQDVDVLHFAGHARGEPNAPWRARLWLGSDRDAHRLEPMLATRIVQEPLTHLALVVLSGCETALPSRRRALGSDGLAAAFLARGAAAVVATLWKVDDRSIATLMTSLHDGLARGDDAAFALRNAQLRLLRSPRPHDRHPGSWAACRLVGLPVSRPQQ